MNGMKRNVTGIVESLWWRKANVQPGETDALAMQAGALALPIMGEQEVAETAGWHYSSDYARLGRLIRPGETPDEARIDGDRVVATDWLDAVDYDGLSAPSYMPTEYWEITPALADELERDGQVIYDYQSAASEQGYELEVSDAGFSVRAPGDDDPDLLVYPTAEEAWFKACFVDDIEPEEIRIPARIDRSFDGLIVWARVPDQAELVRQPERPAPSPAPAI